MRLQMLQKAAVKDVVVADASEVEVAVASEDSGDVGDVVPASDVV